MGGGSRFWGQRAVQRALPALTLALASCHLIFPFGADQPTAAEAGVDASGNLEVGGGDAENEPDAGIPGAWIAVPAATFTMGSPVDEPCREVGGGKETEHKVTLTYDLLVAATEVTREDYAQVMGAAPPAHQGCVTRCPAGSITWHQAAGYCNALSARAKLERCYACAGSGAATACAEHASYSGAKLTACPGYRLPTEAEWEYIYRAGSATALYNGPITACDANFPDANAEAIAWYGRNAGGRPHAVGGKLPNAWGLYDMAGNLYEWCHDWYADDLGAAPRTDPVGPASGTARVLRGGAFNWHTRILRAAYRYKTSPTFGANNVGFRCLRRK